MCLSALRYNTYVEEAIKFLTTKVHGKNKYELHKCKYKNASIP